MRTYEELENEFVAYDDDWMIALVRGISANKCSQEESSWLILCYDDFFTLAFTLFLQDFIASWNASREWKRENEIENEWVVCWTAVLNDDGCFNDFYILRKCSSKRVMLKWLARAHQLNFPWWKSFWDLWLFRFLRIFFSIRALSKEFIFFGGH